MADETKASPKLAAVKEEGPKSRGWVDDAVDAIADAEKRGIDLKELPHDTQSIVKDVRARPEGQRALGDKAHELDHVKRAAQHVRRKLDALRESN